MKKFLCMILVFLTVLLAAGCAAIGSGSRETTTLMVYMIGSDLESKSGAGTEDLQEMAGSGVDLSKVNLLVYAGGSPTWHTDLAAPEQHTLLRLTENGFETVAATDTYSMGLSQCLTTFLTYGYENFPADRYGLILWDHGNGPVIGYGKDMLFENDCLTLAEMAQALADSPFHGENKLDFVGFDACLMASAELASVWAPYANYLVASQEVEPAFGWNYSFLSAIGTCDTPTLLKNVTDAYLADCLAYFEDRGYKDRDTTLSFLDLSRIPELENAINALFTRAAADVDREYNQLTARRANTRDLGRATTGSEYDLVDLQDMAMWLGEMYPQEATDLLLAIENAVVSNATNGQGLCGLSLYYPFYNKPYYEKDWSAAYAQLGAYPAYRQYLEGYERIWLGNDKLDSATSQTPEAEGDTYTLQLTPEQTENLAGVKYYILIRDGEEYFTRIFSSSDVENENGLLTAGFDGNVLYVTDDFGNYHIPVSAETDRVGETGRYIASVALTNCSLDILQPDDFEVQSQAHRYYLNIHKDSGQVTVSTLSAYDKETDGDLTGGKKADSDLSQWTNAYFFHDSHRYLSRYDNGAIMPVDQWPADTVISGVSYALENGLDFVYAPLVAGEYYLLFEMEDTQGNRYCSELLPIHVDGTLPEQESHEKPLELDWTSGEEILLTQSSGVTVWLRKTTSFGSEGYALKAQNTNDYPVIVEADDLFWGENLLCRESFGFLEVAAGETVENDYGIDLGPISDIGLTDASGQIRFLLTLRHGVTYAAIRYEIPCVITLSEHTMLQPSDTTINYNRFDQPVLHCTADYQLLFESEQLRLHLIGLGGNGSDESIRGAVMAENLTDQPISLDLEGMLLDQTYVPMYVSKLTIPAKVFTYIVFTVDDYNLKPLDLSSASSIKILARQYEYNPLFSGNCHSRLFWCDVQLQQAGKADKVSPGKLLYAKDGISISLLQSKLDYGYRASWYLVVTNTTDRDIALDLLDVTADGQALTRFTSISDSAIPAGATAVCPITHSNYETKEPVKSLSFRFRVMDFKKEAILYTMDSLITLTAPKES